MNSCLSLEAGRVHGLLGANGAGKSTLIKNLSGAISASGGTLQWKGRPAEITSPHSANALGIATIHQHIPLAPSLSVLENVFLSDTGLWRRNRADREAYEALCARVDCYVPADAMVADLSIGERQMVAILSALNSGADLIVMDEPTASLADEEREVVYRIVEHLSSKERKGILFVSHFLDEVVSLTDQVSVLRDGVVVFEARTDDLDEARIAEAIVGREIVAVERTARAAIDAVRRDATPLLELQALEVPGVVGPVSLRVAAGEIVGVAGLLGSGRSELIHAIHGANPSATGEVLVEGRRVRRSTSQ